MLLPLLPPRQFSPWQLIASRSSIAAAAAAAAHALLCS
jgi:hypothetical protein